MTSTVQFITSRIRKYIAESSFKVRLKAVVFFLSSKWVIAKTQVFDSIRRWQATENCANQWRADVLQDCERMERNSTKTAKTFGSRNFLKVVFTYYASLFYTRTNILSREKTLKLWTLNETLNFKCKFCFEKFFPSTCNFNNCIDFSNSACMMLAHF